MTSTVGRRPDQWSGAWQASLFDDAPERQPFETIGARSRIRLDEASWVDFVPGWCGQADTLFADLLEQVPWQAERRPMYERVVPTPRLLAFYEEGDPLPDARLAQARTALNARYHAEPGGPLRTAGLCLYRDGRDSVAWHGDRIGRSRTEDTVVAILALGSPRVLALRPNGGQTQHRLSLGHGDLAVMGGACQRAWEHQIAKTAQPVGPRISVQFRQRGVR